MNLERISAPLFVKKNSGLNDNLNGVERTVQFDLLGRAGRGCGSSAVSGKVETNGAKALWISARRRVIHQYERNPAG